MTNPNVRLDLEALKVLLSEATPTPWALNENEGMDEAWCDWHSIGNLSMTGGKASSDSSLARAAVNALPDLIAHIERLQNALKPLAEAKVANTTARGDGCWALGVTGLTLGHIREARATLTQGTTHD